MKVTGFIAALSLSLSVAGLRPSFGAQDVNLHRLEQLRKESTNSLYTNTAQTPITQAEFAPRYFEQPLDHFSKDNTHTFLQRYWVNTRHYKPGKKTVVVVIDGGETSGEDRLPFLDTGIADILPKEFNGIGIVLEHRYYGESIAVKNLTTDSLRWLNNEQAAADSANFMRFLEIDGVSENITATNVPWIYYGGSYAGARAAHMRVLYPDIVFGAIASSAVTHAVIENWEYYDIIRQAADPACSSRIESAVSQIDLLLKRDWSAKLVKRLFGVEDLRNVDFASLIALPLSQWQGRNWDPAVGSKSFETFCEWMIKPKSNSRLSGDGSDNKVDGLYVGVEVWNYAKYIKEFIVPLCPEGVPVEECFGTFDEEIYKQNDLGQHWRLWIFQVCTQWGYFATSPPSGHPRIISSLIDLDYEAKICQQAFPPGKHFQVPALPNITAVNALGDFDIAANRLAFVDGAVDPWKACTPHSDYAQPRPDTTQQPFKLIQGGVHHWDENGLRNPRAEPLEIQKIHREEIAFVREWLQEFKYRE